MSLVMGEHGTSTSRRRRWPWVIVAVLIAAIVAAAFVAGRSSNTRPSGQAPPQQPGSSAQPPGAQGRSGPVQWAPAPGVPAAGPVPSSPMHGPQQVSGPIASGYSHDELGAVVAGINISMRLSSDAGPGVYRSVVEQQTVGERQSTLTRLASEPPSANAPQPQKYWYRIVRGDPDGEVVQLQLLAQTPQTAQMGGYVQLDRTVVWRDGDWALQLPVGQAQLVPSTQGFQPLEGL